MPLMTWATHVLQWMEQRAAQRRRISESHKTILSSDCRLQFACMMQESLVIADQNDAVNTFPGLVHTARHTTRVANTRSRRGNPIGSQPPKEGPMIGVKS